MSNSVVLTEIEDGVITITLNRPEAKNAVNKAVAEGVAAAIDELEGNPELRVGILTGAGGTFCSGMDLKAFVSGELPIVEGRGLAGLCEYTTKKPLLAAVEGYALAGGFEVAISCDLIVAAEDAKFGIPEVKRGLAAGAGGLVKLPKQISPRIAMELALTGDFISAQRAYELGLINSVAAPGGALEAARGLAQRISANGPLAVAASKAVVDHALDWSREEMFVKQQDLIRPVFTSEDAIEGATAFAEKRAPQWKGK
ncbi:crotonase/enoyl-CoA hydratase family protein [Parahaliea mediterranea]|uniref:Crotonase/enoyl-CoA hydratase family protein n=1 Tax=Parahaliea mediterranea TaxID=651086 RepID=A0A939IJF5_9GAMM|nr:crotonase/enoyl-CoA hydratase family protein [Parahaliea mediterranea]MBN7797609.1 crotonase/enoyl-CoA hydratase family protein [Parahaliea mediterranea]